MPVVIPFPFLDRGEDLAPIHPTTPRPGVYVAPVIPLRSTGPAAHISPYVADEQREVNRQIVTAVGRVILIIAGLALAWCALQPVITAASLLGLDAP